MARVHAVRANKDYPAQGIKKGETYYKWTTRTVVGKRYIGTTHRSKVRPTRAQLTSSEFLSRLYELEDGLGDRFSMDAFRGSENWMDDFSAERDSLIGEIEELRDETQEKLDNMPEGLQQGDTGQLLQERIDGLEGWTSDLESVEPSDEEEGLEGVSLAELETFQTELKEEIIPGLNKTALEEMAGYLAEVEEAIDNRENAIQSAVDEITGTSSGL